VAVIASTSCGSLAAGDGVSLQEPAYAGDTIVRITLHLMLPEALNCPSQLAELLVYSFIPCFVSRELSLPKCRVRLGLRGMNRAPVPKTAIHEDGDTGGHKYQVGIAG